MKMAWVNPPRDLQCPPREFSVMPFWFWNDALDAAEIVGQIADFERHGVYGFIIHPRIGLPQDMEWMSDALLDFYAVAIKEAARRGMKVLLYDEGMYPSEGQGVVFKYITFEHHSIISPSILGTSSYRCFSSLSFSSLLLIRILLWATA